MSTPSCLALEASTERLSIAGLANGRTLVWEATPARSQSERLFEHATGVLAELGTDIQGLGLVAFGCGPGSFTGLRIIAAAAQALAFALRIPVTRASSLAVQAATAMRMTGVTRVAVCNDARMGRAYWGMYARFGQGMRAERPDCVIDPARFHSDAQHEFLAVGSGWGAYPELTTRHRDAISMVRADILPSAADLLEMALVDFEQGAFVEPDQALPNYLGHGPVALPAPASGARQGLQSSQATEIDRP
jgi:tRNA threonylcarbamoyladenosine biosynthesis protein TsaB